MTSRRATTLAIPVFLTSDEVVTYPHAHVHLGDLRGPEGNAFAIVSAATEALRRAGVSDAEVESFSGVCFSGDYAFLLQTVRATLVCTEIGPGVGPDGGLLPDDED